MKRILKRFSTILFLFLLIYLISMFLSLGFISISHGLDISFTKSHFRNPDFRILSPGGIQELLRHSDDFLDFPAGGVLTLVALYSIFTFYFLLKVENIPPVESKGVGALRAATPGFFNSGIKVPMLFMVSVVIFLGYIFSNSIGFLNDRNSVVTKAKKASEYLFHLNKYFLMRVFNRTGTECSIAHVLSVKPASLYKRFDSENGDFQDLVSKMRYYQCTDIGQDLYLGAFFQGKLSQDQLIEFLFLLLENGKFSFGKEMIESLDPDKIDFRIRYFYGRNLMGVREFDSALDQFSRVLTEKPDFSDAFYLRGVCLQALGKKESAMRDYRMAIDLLGSHAEAQKNLDILKGGK